VTSNRLENLVRTGALKHEPVRAEELDGLKQSGMCRLCDAQREDLSFFNAIWQPTEVPGPEGLGLDNTGIRQQKPGGVPDGCL
jgi:hypothetical protein